MLLFLLLVALRTHNSLFFSHSHWIGVCCFYYTVVWSFLFAVKTHMYIALYYITNHIQYSVSKCLPVMFRPSIHQFWRESRRLFLCVKFYTISAYERKKKQLIITENREPNIEYKPMYSAQHTWYCEIVSHNFTTFTIRQKRTTFTMRWSLWSCFNQTQYTTNEFIWFF